MIIRLQGLFLKVTILLLGENNNEYIWEINILKPSEYSQKNMYQDIKTLKQLVELF